MRSGQMFWYIFVMHPKPMSCQICQKYNNWPTDTTDCWMWSVPMWVVCKPRVQNQNLWDCLSCWLCWRCLCFECCGKLRLQVAFPRNVELGFQGLLLWLKLPGEDCQCVQLRNSLQMKSVQSSAMWWTEGWVGSTGSPQTYPWCHIVCHRCSLLSSSVSGI